MRKMVAMCSLCLVSTAALANPLTEVVMRALKFFGVGHEAAAVERAAGSGTREAGEKAAKALDNQQPLHSRETPSGESGNAALMGSNEMNFSAEPKGAPAHVLSQYKRLRESGRNGDVRATVEAHRLVRAEHITDTGEPYYGYWLFWQLGRPLATGLRKLLRDEVEADCRSQVERRKFDHKFDAECRALPLRVRNDGGTAK